MAGGAAAPATPTPIGKCCKAAPPVLVYDQAGRRASSVLDPGGLNRTTTYQYDANDNVRLVTKKERDHDTSALGDLNETNARVSFAAAASKRACWRCSSTNASPSPSSDTDEVSHASKASTPSAIVSIPGTSDMPTH